MTQVSVSTSQESAPKKQPCFKKSVRTWYRQNPFSMQTGNFAEKFNRETLYQEITPKLVFPQSILSACHLLIFSLKQNWHLKKKNTFVLKNCFFRAKLYFQSNII